MQKTDKNINKIIKYVDDSQSAHIKKNLPQFKKDKTQNQIFEYLARKTSLEKQLLQPRISKMNISQHSSIKHKDFYEDKKQQKSYKQNQIENLFNKSVENKFSKLFCRLFSQQQLYNIKNVNEAKQIHKKLIQIQKPKEIEKKEQKKAQLVQIAKSKFFKSIVFKQNQSEQNFQYESNIFMDNISIENRHKFGIIFDNIKRIMYIYGGIGYDIFGDLYQINLCDKTKKQINIQNDTNLNLRRYGHKILLKDNRYIIVLGGIKEQIKKFGVYDKSYGFQNFFFVIDLKTNKVNYKNYLEYPQMRKYFSCELIDNEYIIVLGGQTPDNQILNDFWVFSFTNDNWLQLNLESDQKNFIHNGIYNHEMLKVIKNEESVMRKQLPQTKTIKKVDSKQIQINKRQNRRDFFQVVNYLVTHKRSPQKKLKYQNFYSPQMKQKSKNKKYWIQSQIKNKKRFNEKKKKTNFSQIQNKWFEQFTTILQKEKVFLFGGINFENKFNQFNILSLQFNKIDKKFYFIELPFRGQKPLPRIGFCLMFDHNQQQFILHGGQLENNRYTNEIWLYNYTKQKWNIKKVHNDFLNDQRAYHGCVFVDSNLCVYGGINQNGFCSNQLLNIQQELFVDKTKLQNQKLNFENYKKKYYFKTHNVLQNKNQNLSNQTLCKNINQFKN